MIERKNSSTRTRNKDWKKADMIRDSIKEKGFSISDGEGGPVLRKG
ncbi:hypothetical protein KY358_02705 [Candidatus Woesearchaeota archaeon]|nr:hypothetical protein [Candidatus Woesearchaeota archaeon]